MTPDELREAIRSRIAALGISTEHAARISGLQSQVIHYYLSGKDTSVSRVLKIADGLGIDVSLSMKRNYDIPNPPPRGRKRLS